MARLKGRAAGSWVLAAGAAVEGPGGEELSFDIWPCDEPRGWLLRLLRDGVEVGVRVYECSDAEQDRIDAYGDALDGGWEWLATHGAASDRE